MECLFNIAVVIFCVSGIVYFMFIRPQKRRNKEKVIQQGRDAHLKMLAEGIERLGQHQVTIDTESCPVSSVARETWGYPPQRDQWFEEILPRNITGSDWDFAIHIHEGAEQYLGSEQFFGLENKFACVPGVDECKQEDREVFLIKTSVHDQKSVIDALWEVFLKSATEGEMKANQRGP